MIKTISIKSTVTLACVLLIFSCSKKIISSAEKTKSDTAVNNSTTVTLHPANDLLLMPTGKVLMQNHCTGCHRFHAPADFTKEKWDSVLPIMFNKAKLTDENVKTQIRDYIYSNLSGK
ncbi:MAG: hypothetical protein WCI97_04520 [Bacteroidota bacterium]